MKRWLALLLVPLLGCATAGKSVGRTGTVVIAASGVTPITIPFCVLSIPFYAVGAPMYYIGCAIANEKPEPHPFEL